LIERLRRKATPADGGFTMVEVMVSLVIIAIVASAGVAFFVNGIRGVSGEKQRQVAAQIANEQIETVQSVPVGQLVSGRSQSKVDAVFTSAAAGRLEISSQDDETASGDYDSTATAHRSFRSQVRRPSTG